jgi:hypothetical protein
MTRRVFVKLKGEGTDVRRPTQAEALPDGSFRLLPTPDYDPADEQWEFVPGTCVWCEPQTIGGEQLLVAVRPSATKLPGRRTA